MHGVEKTVNVRYSTFEAVKYALVSCEPKKKILDNTS